MPLQLPPDTGCIPPSGAAYINRFQIKVSQITSRKLHFSWLVNDFWSPVCRTQIGIIGGGVIYNGVSAEKLHEIENRIRENSTQRCAQ